jgi:hypothetical protein
VKGTKRPVAEYLGFPYNGKSLVSTGSTIVGLMREHTLDILHAPLDVWGGGDSRHQKVSDCRPFVIDVFDICLVSMNWFGLRLPVSRVASCRLGPLWSTVSTIGIFCSRHSCVITFSGMYVFSTGGFLFRVVA